MIYYALRRFGVALAVAWLALTLAFVALRWVPGDALDATLERAGVSDDEIDARRATLGFNDPIGLQYLTYLAGIVRGDWGQSLITGQPVTEIIGQNMRPTAALALSSLGIAVFLGAMLGALAGVATWRVARYAAEGIASLMLATPVYWTATLAVYAFTVEWDLLPGIGGDDARHLILPACVLGFHTAGSIAQVTASSVREAKTQDFVRTARAKGLARVRVLEHTLRVGLLPVVAVVALQLGFLLGGAVITETIFVRRGLGRVLLTAIDQRDYPVIQGVVALTALLYSIVNAVADVAYGLLDPRIEQ